ncbi:putative dTDP-4-dehydrorhamnose reductase [Dioscorea sansibarensis]
MPLAILTTTVSLFHSFQLNPHRPFIPSHQEAHLETSTARVRITSSGTLNSNNKARFSHSTRPLRIFSRSRQLERDPGQSAAMTSATANGSQYKFLIYGRTGWIGGLLGQLCAGQGIPYQYGAGRLEDRASLEADLAAVKPTHVFNAAGVTGRPNVDWCETHRVETIRANVVGTLTLADVCRAKGLVLINYATGCIFEYDEKHPEGSGIGFKEEDIPNFIGSFYSKTKAMVEDLLKDYENVCTLRVRMPISSDLSNPRNFITKITRYEKVVNIPNSMTILDEFLPISIEMAKRNLTGIYNFTNPGVVSHNEILEMYRDYIDPTFTWKNFDLEEQAKVIVAPRSNNELDTTKLKNEFPELMPIKESLIKYVFEPNKKTSSA